MMMMRVVRRGPRSGVHMLRISLCHNPTFTNHPPFEIGRSSSLAQCHLAPLSSNPSLPSKWKCHVFERDTCACIKNIHRLSGRMEYIEEGVTQFCIFIDCQEKRELDQIQREEERA